MGEFIELDALEDEGSFRAYVARPEGGTPTAAIVVIQEIFGVNAGIRRKVDDWAAAGYLALAPDMFWRFRAHFDADPDVPDEMAEAFALRTRFNDDAGIRDVEVCLRWARAALGGGKVGVVGFCMGGRVAYLAATRTAADATVGYYGAGIDQKLGEAHAIAKPLLLHFAEGDHFIPAEVRTTIHAALDDIATSRSRTIPGSTTASPPPPARRDEAAATRADARTRAFFAEHLA